MDLKLSQDHRNIIMQEIKNKYGEYSCELIGNDIKIGNFKININDYVEYKIKLDLIKGLVRFT